MDVIGGGEYTFLSQVLPIVYMERKPYTRTTTTS